ncbi:ATP-binding cassette domain-containing protein [Microbacterium sp. MYb62]|uniref:ABC transporter ATP-binding protein/permease n=1 Tax=Microbacterium sp. MYb62 TaxID=1848690 RepID=UPI0011B0C804|nr:ATP-binding cassette domain-containing protein [Microbacterium sp. MYb62]
MTYGRDGNVVALDGADLKIEAGEFVAIEGESGSGKSTLLSLIGLLEKPTSGTYRLRGRAADSVPSSGLSALRSDNFSYIFQGFHLLERRTVLDNVALPLLYRGLSPEEARARAADALQRVDMESFANTQGNVLSGGQRQRVAIARALASKAPILVADEPTGNLDSANTENVVQALEEVNASGTTIVLVTHSADVASRAHRRVRVSDGKITDDTPMVSPEGVGRSALRTPPGHASQVRPSAAARDILENLLSRPSRLVGFLAAVAVAVGLVVATLGLSYAASSQVSTLFDAVASKEVTITQAIDEETLPPTAQTLDRLRGLNGVEAVADAVEYVALVQSGDGREAVQTPWIHARGEVVEAGRLTLVAGSSWSGELGPDEVLVGEALAERLNIAAVGASPTIVVNGVPHVVVGVFSKSPRQAEWIGAVLTAPEPLPPLTTGVDDTLITTRVGAAQQVAREAPLVMNPFAPESVKVASPPDPSGMRNSIEASVASSMLVVTIVALVGTILSVALASLASAAERRVEFGLRRALGAKSRHIASMLAVESALTGVVGAILGLAGGLVAVLAVTLANRWTPIFDIRLAGLAIIVGVIVSVFGSLAGAIRAIRIQPNSALRPLQ